jgi:TonB-dependent SusC/RagA subfamily outer membrane receptor
MRIPVLVSAIPLLGTLLLPDLAVAQAQGRAISGVVTRSVGARPIAGATVTVTGSPQFVQTDDSGRYTILAPDGDVRLSFRAIGFTRKDVIVPATQTSMDVALTEDVFELSAVVVTGQATTVERRNATTPTSMVLAEDVNKVAAPTIESALTGRVAGVNLQSNSGAPGGGIQMQIRGNNTILGAYDPLYVIDGGPAAELPDGINWMKPSDILRVEVLKTPAELSPYGSRGANGVVVITTRMAGSVE